MNYLILTIQIIVSIILCVVILLQSKGGGLGSAFGNAQYQHTRRGADKALFQITIILSTLFIGLSLVSVLI